MIRFTATLLQKPKSHKEIGPVSGCYCLDCEHLRAQDDYDKRWNPINALIEETRKSEENH